MELLKKLLFKYYLWFVLAFVIIFFAIASPYFFTAVNLTNIFVQNTYLVIASMGIAMVMVSGGADLSVSYQMGLVSVSVGIMLTVLQWPVWICVVLGLGIGALMGFINGVVTVLLKVHTMVTTLATMTIYQGLAFIIADSKTYFNLPESFKAIGQKYIGAVPICVIIMIVLVVLAFLIMNKSYFGRHIFALGGNAEAARLAGINTNVIRVLGFIMAGLFVAAGSIVITSRSGSASATISVDAVFTCITACILGGISFQGGSGSIIGVFVGVMILGVLANGMQLVGLTIYHQYIVKGIILVAAIAFDNYQKNSRKRVVKNERRATS